MILTEASLLRVFVNAGESQHGVPLYRTIVERAHSERLAGASVFGVELSLGSHQRLHDVASEYASYELPLVIELVDTTDRVQGFLETIGALVREGFAVTSAAGIVRPSQASEGRGFATTGDEIPYHPPGEVSTMHTKRKASRVTIYLGSSDTWQGRNLAVAIVEKCREMGMAGATVSRGILGFGKHAVIHQPHLWRPDADLPERVEIIDRPAEIERLLPVLLEMAGDRLIVTEDVRVVQTRPEGA